MLGITNPGLKWPYAETHLQSPPYHVSPSQCLSTTCSGTHVTCRIWSLQPLLVWVHIFVSVLFQTESPFCDTGCRKELMIPLETLLSCRLRAVVPQYPVTSPLLMSLASPCGNRVVMQMDLGELSTSLVRNLSFFFFPSFSHQCSGAESV